MEESTPFKKKLKEIGIFLLDILYNATIIILLVVLIRSFLVSPFRVVGISMQDTLHDKEFILIDKLSYLIGDIDRGDPIVFLPPSFSGNSPKFEISAQTDAKGNGKLQFQDISTTKPAQYCQNKLLIHFWFCHYGVEAQDKAYLTSQEEKEAEPKRFILTEEDVERGYLDFKAAPHQAYNLVVYPPTGPEYFVKRVIGIPGDTVKIENGRVYLKGENEKDFFEINETFLNKGNYKKTYMKSEEGNNIFEVPEGHYFVLGDNRGDSTDSRIWLEPMTQTPIPFVPEENIVGKVMIVLWPLTEIHFVSSADL